MAFKTEADRDAFARDMRAVTPVMPIGRAAEVHRIIALSAEQKIREIIEEAAQFRPETAVGTHAVAVAPACPDTEGRMSCDLEAVSEGWRCRRCGGFVEATEKPKEPVETRLLHYLVKHHGGFGVWITDGSMPLQGDAFNGWHFGGGTLRLTEIVELCREPISGSTKVNVEFLGKTVRDGYYIVQVVAEGSTQPYKPGHDIHIAERIGNMWYPTACDYDPWTDFGYKVQVLFRINLDTMEIDK